MQEGECMIQQRLDAKKNFSEHSHSTYKTSLIGKQAAIVLRLAAASFNQSQLIIGTPTNHRDSIDPCQDNYAFLIAELQALLHA